MEGQPRPCDPKHVAPLGCSYFSVKRHSSVFLVLFSKEQTRHFARGPAHRMRRPLTRRVTEAHAFQQDGPDSNTGQPGFEFAKADQMSTWVSLGESVPPPPSRARSFIH